MIRFYANQAGYLQKGRKIAVLAQENRADEMEKMKDKKVSPVSGMKKESRPL